ncbi:hypothetical protein [Methylobacterium aquaticum]|uniref:hypothetical protein n=1 Tax=Methylobacterium aquaticum TaxID=270351 RepID=UPI000A7AB2A1|nr:hypothetical protein [Methylobacterium aquaticum]
MAASPDEIRIGLVGPKSAGKSNIFETFHEALDRGRHGFPGIFNPIVEVSSGPRKDGSSNGDRTDEKIWILNGGNGDSSDKHSSALHTEIDATLPTDVVTRHYTLSFHESGGPLDRTVLKMAITDAAGEHTFNRGPHDPTHHADRRRLVAELSQCKGFVVVVPFSDADDPDFIAQLDRLLKAFDTNDASPPAGPAAAPRPVVIALTRYDALFTEFGCEAFRIAVDPRVVTAVINRVVEKRGHGASFERTIAKYDVSEGGRYKIVFVPTSSFGFLPDFGCVNLDPDVSPEEVAGQVLSGNSPSSFKVPLPAYRKQRHFPFLNADPFVYAATGLANPYFVSIARAKRQASYDPLDRTAWLRPDPFEPKEQGPTGPGTTSPQDEPATRKAKPEPPPEPPQPDAGPKKASKNDSGGWFKKARDLLNRVDIDL